MSQRLLNSRQLVTIIIATLSCACLLLASSSQAALANWELNATGTGSDVGAVKAFSESSAFRALGLEKSVNDAPPQVSFRAVAGNESSANRLTVALGNGSPANETNGPEATSRSIQGRATGSDESIFRAPSQAASRPTTELDEAMARTAFNDDFVSVPSVQFASLASGAAALSAVSSATNVGVVPVPEMSSFLPIIGLLVAVLGMQMLRRCRVPQRITFHRLV